MTSSFFAAFLALRLLLPATSAFAGCDWYALFARTSSPKNELAPDELQKVVEQKLGFKTKVYNNSTDPDRIELSLVDEKREELAHLDVVVDDRDKGLVYFSGIRVKEGLREKGIADYLFSRILALVPNASEVSAVLTETNKEVAQKLLRGGLPCLEAIQGTPFYKTHKKFGFTNVINPVCSHKINSQTGKLEMSFSLTVTR